MTIHGLDTIALIFLAIALAIAITYILFYGWKFQFTKQQFGYLVLLMLIFGMFIEAWLRKTGDELLLIIVLVILMLLTSIRSMLGRAKWRRRGA